RQALERMLDIAIQFAWGLHTAHEQGLVHQDIKPANVMLTLKGIAKVTDFGLAKARASASGQRHGVGDSQQSVLVSAGMMTPAYCSPEQMAGRPLSRRTDMWSWGVSLLEMFLGEVRWLSGSAAGEVLASYQPEDTNIPPLPAPLAKLLAHCFKLQPEERPFTMLEVAMALQEIYAREIGQAYRREMPQPAKRQADSLNNLALSLYDLGKVEEAKHIWTQAMQADPHHLETMYNRGIVLWRQGEITDDVLIRQLQSLRNTQGQQQQLDYLLAQIHLERGDAGAARSLLKDVAIQAPHDQKVQEMRQQVQSALSLSNWEMICFQTFTAPVKEISMCADRSMLATLNQEGRIDLWDTTTGQRLHTFQGDPFPLSMIELSANGAILAGYSVEEELIYLWDTTTGIRLPSRIKVQHGFRGMNADGSAVVAFHGDNLCVWETATGSLLQTVERNDRKSRLVRLPRWPGLQPRWSPPEHIGMRISIDTYADAEVIGFDGIAAAKSVFATSHLVTQEYFSANGKSLILALGYSYKEGIQSESTNPPHILCLFTGQSMRVFRGHTGNITALCLSPDGDWLLSGSEDTTLRLWETTTGSCIRLFQGHTRRIRHVGMSADKRWAISVSEDQAVRLWEIATGRCLYTKKHFKDELYSSDNDYTIEQLYREGPLQPFLSPFLLSQVQSYETVKRHEIQVETLLNDTKQAYSTTQYTVALKTLQEIRATPGWKRNRQSLEAWSRLSHYCRRTGIQASWLARTFQSNGAVYINAEGHYMVATSDNTTIQLRDITTGDTIHSFQGATNGNILMSANGRWLFTQGENENGIWSIRVWEIATERSLYTIEEQKLVCLSTYGHWFITKAQDTLTLWETATGRCVSSFSKCSQCESVEAASLSADGHLLAYASSRPGGTIYLSETTTGHSRTIQGTGVIQQVSLSADGSKLLFAGNRRQYRDKRKDYTAWLMETATGLRIRQFQGHTDYLQSVHLSADGRWALSGSYDKTVRLWEVSTGHCLHTLRIPESAEVPSVSLSIDKRWVVAYSVNTSERDAPSIGHSHIWELDWDLEALNAMDWDEGATSYLETFLSLQALSTKTAAHEYIPLQSEHHSIRRWSDEAFQELLLQLQYADYGWLRPEGVQRKLIELASARAHSPEVEEVP
ncbi:MAG: protein kinase, partial [Ktedonobacteraceae bacterium]|nr:protein kinase [Ktedonobacteraceae bacterium]